MSRKRTDSILVVDDDPFVLNSISLLLGAYGYQVTSSPDTVDALAKFQEGGTDVVLTDIRMPSVSGIEFLEKIHTLSPEIPVILMTAFADLDIAVAAIKKGAFDFIIKPYKPEQLINSIEKAAGYRRLLRVEKDYKIMLEEFSKEMETLVAERTMGLMALTVADKVRNPAATIQWTCRRILEKENISERTREGLRDISEEAGKLESVVKDFQDLLKSRKSMFTYEDINAVMEGIVSIIREEADSKGLHLTVRLSGQPLKINARKNLLGAAFFHLLRNAVEATPEGGRVEIETSRQDSNVILTVTDSGHGITAEDADKIFDPFFSTKQQRFGMGLPMVRQIISEHLGKIEVKSEDGKGTTFRITFPERWVGKSL